MKLSGRTQPLYPRFPTLDALQVIKKLGFDGVEICLEANDLSPRLLNDGTIVGVRERVNRLGLSPAVVGYHVDYIYDDELFEMTVSAIRCTRLFGVKIFIFSGTTAREGDPDPWQRMLDRTRQLVKLAEDEDVILAQEFEPGFIVGSTADLIRLFEEIPSHYLAANLDLGHVFLCDPNPLEAVRQVGEKIVHGHIENMTAGIHNHLLPQEGDMDLGSYLGALKNSGFTGALALDLYQYDYEVVASSALSYLRGLLEAI